MQWADQLGHAKQLLPRITMLSQPWSITGERLVLPVLLLLLIVQDRMPSCAPLHLTPSYASCTCSVEGSMLRTAPTPAHRGQPPPAMQQWQQAVWMCFHSSVHPTMLANHPHASIAAVASRDATLRWTRSPHCIRQRRHESMHHPACCPDRSPGASARARGCSTGTAPCCCRRSRAPGLRSYTSSCSPARSRLVAIGPPMLPIPMKPTCMSPT